MVERSVMEQVADIAPTGSITASDVLSLRRKVFADGRISRAEAEALLALDASSRGSKAPEWFAFLAEAIADHIVHQVEPAGYVSEDNGAWLIESVSQRGLDVGTEVELLVCVLERSTASPARLSAHALRRVADAVVDGEGELPGGGALVAGVIGGDEVALLRRVLHAFGGAGNAAVTRDEAEVLFDLNDRTAGAAHDPAWTELFVKALASFVLSGAGYEAPSREEALRQQVFVEDADVDIGGFFGRMVSGGLGGLFDALRADDDVEAQWKARNEAAERAMRAGEVVDAGEARWLADRIGRDREVHDNEAALLQFLKQASSSIHPDLKPLIDRVA